MDTRKVAQDYRRSKWAEIMRDRQESGLSVRTYCNQHDIKECTYYYWQQKLREAACEQLLPINTTASIVPAGWAKCNVAEANTSNSYSSNTSINVAVGQFKISISQKNDIELLSEVCRALVRIC